jgi:hypothetical protein
MKKSAHQMWWNKRITSLSVILMALSLPGMVNARSHHGHRNTSSALNGDITEIVYFASRSVPCFTVLFGRPESGGLLLTMPNLLQKF